MPIVIKVLPRFSDSNQGPPSLEGFVPAHCVLHRLAVELYSIVYPTISIWGVIRNLMASNEAEWPLMLLEDLAEGFSTSERGGKEPSSEQPLVCLVRLGCHELKNPSCVDVF